MEIDYDKYDQEVNVLIGQTLTKVERVSDKWDDKILFYLDDDKGFIMYHSQDCCENVNIHEIVGDLDNLVGEPIIEAEVVSNSDDPKLNDTEDQYDSNSHTWTFYKLGTKKGFVTISWYGSSNGYYSESVNFSGMVKSK
jgi:hypothetical protein